MRVLARVLGAAATCVFAFIGGWLIYAGASWLNYGRTGPSRPGDALLDRFMPAYEIAELHQTEVAVPAAITFAAAQDIDLQDSPVVRAIFRTREFILRAPHSDSTAKMPFLQQMKQLGWGVLHEEPGRIVVMGAVTQPWKAHVTFQALPPAEFASFHVPGYVKILWTLEAQPVTGSTSIFRTVTRVKTTDAVSREKFRVYWAVFSPGILLIRQEALRIVRESAQRRERYGARS